MEERDLWKVQQMTALDALLTVEGWLGLRMGPNDDHPLDEAARMRLLRIIRAVSWVESKHGSYDGANHGARDPMQAGHPRDAWWRAITGETGDGDRFIRGPDVGPNFWARELAGALEDVLPPAARLSRLGSAAEQKRGHDHPSFHPSMSYCWGVLYLIHRINTAGGAGRTFQCGELAEERLVNGAVKYNGGGDPRYRAKIEAALRTIDGAGIA
jgi:hypothetical protein